MVSGEHPKLNLFRLKTGTFSRPSKLWSWPKEYVDEASVEKDASEKVGDPSGKSSHFSSDEFG